MPNWLLNRYSMKRRRWTQEEDSLLVEAIRESSFNLREIFEDIANKLNRSEKAVKMRWYYVLNNPEHPKYAGTCFTLISRARELRNGKTITKHTVRRTPEKIKSKIWIKIKKLLNLQ